MSDVEISAANIDELEFRAMTPTESDLQLFHDCFAANGSPRSMEMLRWQYLAPPGGPLLVELAVTGGPNARLAAIYAVFPVQMRAAGKRVLALQSLNTLTDVAYRGKGLFVRLAKALYSRSAEAGAQIVYGLPNGNSIHGFLKHLEWKSLDPLPVLVRPLRLGYVLRKIGAHTLANIFDVPLTLARTPKLKQNLEFRTIQTVGTEFDAMWKAFANSVGFAVERDSSYLEWRLQRPGENYETFALYENNVAVGVCIIGTTFGSDKNPVGKLMEYFFAPSHEFASDLLVAEALHRLRQKGCGVVWAWNFEHSKNHAALRRAKFFTPPAKSESELIHVGARALTATANSSERTQWYISLLDSDTD
jgi:hypothetical protein